MSAAPVPYTSPPARDSLLTLTPDERNTARDIWAQLMAGNSEPFESASETVRAHIFEASRVSLLHGDEPDGANPFDA